MTFDFETLEQPLRYKLLVGLVVPRPIALVTSVGVNGIINAAPFSFFNVFSEEPPLLVLGLQSRPDGTIKDTPANIRETGAFVVNLVDEALAEQMNICAVDFPSGESEIEAAGLDLVPGNICGGPAYRQRAGCSRMPPLHDARGQPRTAALHRAGGLFARAGRDP